MKRTIKVFVGDEARRVGTLHYDVAGSRERAAFAYADTWLAAADRFALEPALPLVVGSQFHRKVQNGSVFHGAFADSEPDGWARRVILRDHAKRRQEARRMGQEPKSAQLQAIDFLLAVDDASRVGALRFQDEAGVFCRETEPGRRTAPPLIELKQLLNATRAVETESETAADLEYLRGRGTSLGGMRPKCTVVDDDGGLAVGKFPSVQDERAVTKGEVLAMQLANASVNPLIWLGFCDKRQEAGTQSGLAALHQKLSSSHTLDIRCCSRMWQGLVDWLIRDGGWQNPLSRAQK